MNLMNLQGKYFAARAPELRSCSPKDRRGYPHEVAGISCGIQIQDVGIARGYPRAKAQDVGISAIQHLFLTRILAAIGLRLATSDQRLVTSLSNLLTLSVVLMWRT